MLLGYNFLSRMIRQLSERTREGWTETGTGRPVHALSASVARRGCILPPPCRHPYICWTLGPYFPWKRRLIILCRIAAARLTRSQLQEMLHRGYEVWITCEDKVLPEYQPTVEGDDGKMIACYIPSEAGKVGNA